MDQIFKVFKYQLGNTPRRITLEMPLGATLLSVQEQNGDIVIWALVNDKAPIAERIFDIIYTGFNVPYHPCYGFPKHIGTVKMPDGIVIHVFENFK